MTTQAEAFQNIVGLNFANAVLDELICARKGIEKVAKVTEDEKVSNVLAHIAEHLDAAGALAFFMKDYYGENANKEKPIHEVALKEFEESNLVKLMSEILNVAADTTVAGDAAAMDLGGLLKALGLNG